MTERQGTDMMLTPEVEILGDEKLFVLEIDEKDIAYVTGEEEAIAAVDSITAEEAKRFAKAQENTKITREDSDNGLESRLYRQNLGFVYNSSPVCVLRIVAKRIHRVKVIKNRIPLGTPQEATKAPETVKAPEASTPPPPPPLPSQHC